MLGTHTCLLFPKLCRNNRCRPSECFVKNFFWDIYSYSLCATNMYLRLPLCSLQLLSHWILSHLWKVTPQWHWVQRMSLLQLTSPVLWPTRDILTSPGPYHLLLPPTRLWASIPPGLADFRSPDLLPAMQVTMCVELAMLLMLCCLAKLHLRTVSESSLLTLMVSLMSHITHATSCRAQRGQ